jgi:hypothetical protein
LLNLTTLSLKRNPSAILA